MMMHHQGRVMLECRLGLLMVKHAKEERLKDILL